MSKLSKNVIEKIHEKDIKPLPKWMFILGHIAVWVLFVLSILIGSAAVALGLYKLFVVNDWGILGRLPGGPVGGFLLVLPYMWILIMGLMVFVAYKLFEKTEKGYKVSPWIILALSIGASFVLGSLMFANRSAEGMENFMREKVPPYREYQEFREKVWHAPEKGILPGRILSIKNDSMIIMDDMSGTKWKVDISNAQIPPFMKLTVDDVVIAVGSVEGKAKFTAEGIRPAKILKDRLKQKRFGR
jgi:hypothetical protein